MNAAPRPIDAMIVGAQKAGTSSLAGYLAQHPAVCTHHRVEISYFVDDHEYAEGYEACFGRYFGHCSPDSLLLGKSVTIMADPRLIDRVAAHNPEARVMAVLRNPVARAYSAYWWARRKGYEDLATFEAAIEATPDRHGENVLRRRNTRYLEMGDYAPQVEDLYERFGRDRVRIFLFEDLAADALGVCREAYRFLGVDDAFRPDTSLQRNASSTARFSGLTRLLTAQHPLKRRLRRMLPGGLVDDWKRRAERWNRVPFRQPPIDPETRDRLVEHFRPRNDRLAELIGRDLAAWDGTAPSAPVAAGVQEPTSSA